MVETISSAFLSVNQHKIKLRKKIWVALHGSSGRCQHAMAESFPARRT